MVCNCWMFTPPRFTWGTRRFTSLHYEYHGDALISSQSDAACDQSYPIVSKSPDLSAHVSQVTFPYISYISYIASQRLNPPAPWGSSQHRKKLNRPQCISVQCAIDCPWSMTASPPLLALLLVNSESWIFDGCWLADAESLKGPLSKKTESPEYMLHMLLLASPSSSHIFTSPSAMLGALQSTLVQCFEGSFS